MERERIRKKMLSGLCATVMAVTVINFCVPFAEDDSEYRLEYNSDELILPELEDKWWLEDELWIAENSRSSGKIGENQTKAAHTCTP